MADESTHLYVEVEQWDSTNNKGLLWVSRDTWNIASASNTDIYLAFDSAAADNTAYVGTAGNRTEVWNSDFAAVYTMSQDPSGGVDCIIDSTGNGNHGTPYSMSSSDLIDGSINFSGGTYIQLPNSDIVLPNSDNVTLIAHAALDLSASVTLIGRRLLSFDTSILSGNAIAFGVSYAGKIAYLGYNGNFSSVYEGQPISLNTDYGFAYTKNNDTHQLYLDGVASSTDFVFTPNPTGPNSAYIGKDYGGSAKDRTWRGTIKTVMIFSSAMSGGWIKADYHAQTDNLLTFGATQETVSEPAVTTNSASDVTSTTAILNGILDSLGEETSVDVYFEWGLTTSYGNTTTQQTLSTLTSFSETLTGLTSESTYHFRAAVTDGIDTWYGNDRQFISIEMDEVSSFFMFPF